jgi:hypothetical protein
MGIEPPHEHERWQNPPSIEVVFSPCSLGPSQASVIIRPINLCNGKVAWGQYVCAACIANAIVQANIPDLS